MTDDIHSRLGRIEGAIVSLTDTVSIMSAAVTSLAKVEERVAQHHAQHVDGVERLEKRIDEQNKKLDEQNKKIDEVNDRVGDIEKSDVKQETKIGFTEQIFWLVVAACASGMIGFLFGKIGA